jgi:deferrochelatase/peroxidase EfeB
VGTASVSHQAPAASIDVKDVQGLVRFGYKRMTESCYLLLRILDAGAARAWCAAAPVTNAEFRETPPKSALQVAFTASGLRALGLPEDVLRGFSPEFLSGMAGDESRSRRLGDVGANAPQNWAWGGRGEPDALVILFAEPGLLAGWQSTVTGGTFDSAFETLLCLTTNTLRGFEPFGFRDGISEPEIDWSRLRHIPKDELLYTNIVAAGEFLLGYPNEYGKYTERPLLDAGAKGTADLLPAEDEPHKRDLGRNGTYLVMRQLEQDVRGFWRFVDAAAKSEAPERLRLAEAMVGRTMEGAPLVPPSSTAIAGVERGETRAANNFTYDGDPNGARCPFGAHIRRANPRNADLPGRPGGFLARNLARLGFGSKDFRGDITASTRFHRLLRRGREYGTLLNIEEALQPAPPDDPKRGIHFVCLNANISRQFEFVQNSWIVGTKFDGLSEESDPLLGNRAAVGDCPYTGNFTLPREAGPPQVVSGLPQFITLRGGAYFFLPSVRALLYFASGPK